MYHQVALVALAMASGAQENTETKKQIFKTKYVKRLCERAILSYMKVPFEVVGHKKLFACLLNEACLNTDNTADKDYQFTQDDVNEMVKGKSGSELPRDIKTKLQAIIRETMTIASKKIKAADLEYQIEWRKSNYIYNFNLSLWDEHLAVPKFVVAKVHDYVKYLDLERDFEASDLNLYCSN